MRVAFVGQSTFFEACALEDRRTPLRTAFFEFRRGGDAGALVDRLREWRPDVVIVFRPEYVPAGALRGLDARILGFLTEPIPRSGLDTVNHTDLERRLWELEQVDARAFDRVVSFDPLIATTADAVLPVWRSVPLPVADRFYAPIPRAAAGAPRALFVGRSTKHREVFLAEAKHRFDVLHLAFGVGADELAAALARHDVGINLHNEPYPSFENRVCLHMAAGHLVLTEPLSPTHGIEPGIDVVVVQKPGQLEHALDVVTRWPGTWHEVRVRGRRKAEQFRASRVWPRLIADFVAETAPRRAAA